MSRDRYTPELLWIWCLKIIVGLRFYEFGHDLDRTQPGKSQNQTLWDYEQIWKRSGISLSSCYTEEHSKTRQSFR
ncbi:MAG TPA: hypothetical protein DCG58_06080 [Hyphomonas adhaerens]|uniref:Uncharacterized protein n=1 Tax=Hyphomonas adhaerens TaxID=81029 RepID=A0A3B9GWF5_9PROT|nr:hypothetical protein [Hyphomonas adhaerens]